TGPILDPDALSRRAQNLAEQVKKKISTPQEGLDRPRSFRDDLRKCCGISQRSLRIISNGNCYSFPRLKE
ncbi:MAG: hypothetical protein ACRDRG_01560, partial [Pseudonocardiaceae bacterium]